jgi:hypothetical protein
MLNKIYQRCVICNSSYIFSRGYTNVSGNLNNGFVDRFSGGLSPLFIDKCFGLFSLVGSDYAEGGLLNSYTFNKCRRHVAINKFVDSTIHNYDYDSHEVPLSASFFLRKRNSTSYNFSRRNIVVHSKNNNVKQHNKSKSLKNKQTFNNLHLGASVKPGIVANRINSRKQYNAHLCGVTMKPLDRRRAGMPILRNRSTSAFLILNITRSLLPCTDIYSLHRRNLLIISFRRVQLHLTLDYSDKLFSENVLTSDISFLNLYNY